jgi:hypothetical protein
MLHMDKPIVSRVPHTIMRYTQSNNTLQSHTDLIGGALRPKSTGPPTICGTLACAAQRAAPPTWSYLLWDMYLTNEYVHRTFKKGDGK